MPETARTSWGFRSTRPRRVRGTRLPFAIATALVFGAIPNPGSGPVRAQSSDSAATAAPPPFARLRQDEDYSYLADPSRRTGFFDPIKYIPLGNGESFLSFGGELRYRYEYTRNPMFGEDPQDRNGVFLQRYIVHGDLHLSRNFRLFGQFLSSFADGRSGGPSPVDENQLDLQQAFADFSFDIAPGATLTLRPGRQEVRLGSARLVDVREGPNVRRTFDGARFTLTLPDWRIDALALKPVDARRRVFDDETSHRQSLWGLYGVGKPSWLPVGSIDLYYLGFRDKAGAYEQGVARETRHSIGTRLWGDSGAWDWNNEFVYQFGSFGSGSINAWTAAVDVGYTWREAWLEPRLGLSTAIASGDRNPFNANLQTFNPMFPRGNYFSELALLGPRNFFNVNPSISLKPHRDVTVTGGVNFFWRQSLRDGVYSPNGQLIRAANGSSARYVGTELSFLTEWRVNRHVTLTGIYSHFFPGAFIRETGLSREIDYVELTVKVQI